MKKGDITYIKFSIHREFTDWDCLIIGKGDKGTSAFKVFEIEGDHNLSSNSISFWVSGCEKYCGMTIFKNTEEGKNLQKMIDNKVSIDKIEEYLTMLTVTKLTPKKVLQWIAAISDVWYKMGQDDKAEQIRNALGIRE